ncbi:MAG: NADPH-dependent F420 reductase [Methanomicrobiales archaeon]|nr:NADPH-dependent F420 reductase [Methanomicrobiales archaeon]
MRIGIVGGTGEIGEGLTIRLAPRHDVVIGSREAGKASASSTECMGILRGRGTPCVLRGVTNQEAVDHGEVVILAIPFTHLAATVSALTGLEKKVVVTPVNPLQRSDIFFFAPPPEGSAALLLQRLLPPGTRICTAFNNVAANRWRALDDTLDYSVAVCGDDAGAKQVVRAVVDSIPNLKAFDAGPLRVSPMIEAVTPLLLNIARHSKMKDVGIQFR